MKVTFGSVCSGIEAASVAWGPLGWEAAWFSEIEPFPCALLRHHYPGVPNLGDMTALPARIFAGAVAAPDILCGGTPCQAFSTAGLRQSLDDARGNLSLTFCEIANAIDTTRSIYGKPPAVIFWENVPGVLNTKDNAFGCFLAGLAGEDDPLVAPGGKWANSGYVLGPKRAVAWRVLDAQYFGVAQRRRRVFVVASAREGFDPATVLFESEGVRRDTAPSRKAGEEVAPTIRAGASNGGAGHGARSGDSKDELITFDRQHSGEYGAGAIGFEANMSLQTPETSGVFQTLTRRTHAAKFTAACVRRLTPVECERLQGFPDNYTLIPVRGKPAADGPRYKALGNSWAVPVVRWIGWRMFWQGGLYK